MQAIFISYRRDDAEGHAQTLFKDLVGEFGADAVFMDVAGISPGLDFRKVIDQHTSSCCVLLAIIGKQWVGAVDAAGRSRLADPNDFVRLETASALKRDIAVIPVLVHNAQMPLPEQLPADLRELVFRNNVELTHARWNSDVQVLIKSLRPIFDRANPPALPSPAPPSLPPAPPPPPDRDDTSRHRRLAWGVGVAFAMAVAAGGSFVFVDRQRAEAVRLEAARQQAEADRQTAQAQQAASAAAARAAEQAAAKERARIDAAKKAEEKAARDEAERSRLAAAAEASRQARERALAEELRLKQLAKLAGTCLSGYVWREARVGDKVCVTPAVRRETAQENALASARREAAGGPYGPDTCRQGYVWREAFAGDRVCVTPASRTRSAGDNASAGQHVVH